MLASVRYLLSDLGHWLWTHRLAAGAGLVVVLIGAGALVLALGSGDGDEPSGGSASSPAPAPRVVVKQVPAPENTDDLGFPAFATKNTTRVAGADPIANAAAVALAVHPSTGGSPGPDAVTLVDADDWQGAVAASALAAAPVAAPLLVTEGGGIPPLTANALRGLDPGGSAATAGRQAVRDRRRRRARRTTRRSRSTGGDPAALAAEVDKLRNRLAGEPDAIVVASSDAARMRCPAAAWAARSGDPVLFAGRDSVPAGDGEGAAQPRRRPGLRPRAGVGDRSERR